MRKLAATVLLTAACLRAHAISISTGDAVIRGKRVEYILRMPQYELREGTPAMLLFTQLQLRSNGETARLLDAECHLDPAKNQYLCAADYSFARVPGDLEVQCSLQQVTVPNHVHMLKAERDGKYDQAILDSSFPLGVLTFRPPTKLGIAVTQMSAGAIRMSTSVAQLLLLAALILSSAAHKRRAILAVAFFAGECAAAVLISQGNWQPAPRFAEAAAALGLAYLAVELLAWPNAGGRWLLALAFGTFSGLYFAAFLRESGYRPEYVLSGSVTAGALLAGICGVLRSWFDHAAWLDRYRRITARIAVFGLVAGSTVWFLARLVN